MPFDKPRDLEPHVLASRRCAGHPLDPRTLQRRCIKILRHLGKKSSSVSILLCDDAQIRDLNRRYRNQDRATDVLSFSMADGEPVIGDQELLGDIVISLDTAERQANELGRSLMEESTSLMIHGLLHLLGYDHETKKDKDKMDIIHVSLMSLVTR